MKIFYWLRNSGVWAFPVVVAVALLGILVNSPALLIVAWVGMVGAGVYAARYSHDAKRAMALQARAHAKRAKAAGSAT